VRPAHVAPAARHFSCTPRRDHHHYPTNTTPRITMSNTKIDTPAVEVPKPTSSSPKKSLDDSTESPANRDAILSPSQPDVEAWPGWGSIESEPVSLCLLDHLFAFIHVNPQAPLRNTSVSILNSTRNIYGCRGSNTRLTYSPGRFSRAPEGDRCYRYASRGDLHARRGHPSRLGVSAFPSPPTSEYL
jgi:hypothetical protein